jgi:hypothetical protein
VAVPDPGRRYRYVGPDDVRETAVRSGAHGIVIRSPDDAARWAASVAGPREPFTYVVDVAGWLRLAPRRSEHVACAGGGEVLGAGEITLARAAAGWTVVEISNQSTGYCPDPASWSAVASALDRAGLRRPDGFTSAFVFRRCPSCRGTNIVKDEDFVCSVCGRELPANWNFDSGPDGSNRDPAPTKVEN